MGDECDELMRMGLCLILGQLAFCDGRWRVVYVYDSQMCRPRMMIYEV